MHIERRYAILVVDEYIKEIDLEFVANIERRVQENLRYLRLGEREVGEIRKMHRVSALETACLYLEWNRVGEDVRMKMKNHADEVKRRKEGVAFPEMAPPLKLSRTHHPLKLSHEARSKIEDHIQNHPKGFAGIDTVTLETAYKFLEFTLYRVVPLSLLEPDIGRIESYLAKKDAMINLVRTSALGSLSTAEQTRLAIEEIEKKCSVIGKRVS